MRIYSKTFLTKKMRPVVHLEISNTSDFIEYDSEGYFIALHTPKPLAFTSGVYEIPLPVKIKIPPGYTTIIENDKENLLKGNTVLQCVIENLYWYSSIILRVDTNFVVPKSRLLCKIRLCKTTSFDIETTHI